jgi:hypothetical protein
MHYHLKDKSKASFASGSDSMKLWIQVSVAAVLAFAISFTTDFLGINMLNAFFQGGILAALLCLVVVARYARHWPRQYHPDEIPFQFLP